MYPKGFIHKSIHSLCEYSYLYAYGVLLYMLSNFISEAHLAGKKVLNAYFRLAKGSFSN